MILVLFASGIQTKAPKNRPQIRVEHAEIEYKGKTVRAKRLTVSSEIPIEIEKAWANVKTPSLLQFIAKGMITFKSTAGEFPKQWEVGQTYGVKMRYFGFIPFGGTHYLSIEKIDDDLFKISTKEWDYSAKVWNHDVVMRDLGSGNIYYEDSITIYGGVMTGFITFFAKIFYKHRQNRWQIVADKGLTFGR